MKCTLLRGINVLYAGLIHKNLNQTLAHKENNLKDRFCQMKRSSNLLLS